MAGSFHFDRLENFPCLLIHSLFILKSKTTLQLMAHQASFDVFKPLGFHYLSVLQHDFLIIYTSQYFVQSIRFLGVCLFPFLSCKSALKTEDLLPKTKAHAAHWEKKTGTSDHNSSDDAPKFVFLTIDFNTLCIVAFSFFIRLKVQFLCSSHG